MLTYCVTLVQSPKGSDQAFRLGLKGWCCFMLFDAVLCCSRWFLCFFDAVYACCLLCCCHLAMMHCILYCYFAIKRPSVASSSAYSQYFKTLFFNSLLKYNYNWKKNFYKHILAWKYKYQISISEMDTTFLVQIWGRMDRNSFLMHQYDDASAFLYFCH